MAEQDPLKDEAYFESIDLDELTSRLKRILDIRDRKYGFPPKTYPQCFVGREAVKKLTPTVKGIFHRLMALRR